MTLKQKLIEKYLLKQHTESYLQEARATPLRKFIASIGLDYTKLNPKQMRKWAMSKRYKDYKAMGKIKRIAAEANVQETIILENYNFFLSNFYIDEQNDYEITKEEVISFIKIFEAIPKIKIFRYKSAKRGPYKNKMERMANLKQVALNAINRGGIISSGEGDVIYKKAKKVRTALGSDKMMIRQKFITKSGTPIYHHKAYKAY